MKAKKTKKINEKKDLLHVSIGYATSVASVATSQGEDSAEVGKAAYSPVNQVISGDAAVSCGLPDGSRALILSDGMGKGARAAAESTLVVHMLRKLLKQGQPVARSIKEVNRYLLENGAGDKMGWEKETFATVDLTVIDRVTGRGKFYKMGAAPSYVVRGRRVRKVEQPALPVGIIPTLKLTHVTARLSAGDVIVMISDGIIDSDRNDSQGDWISSFLSDASAGKGPRQLAAHILEEAHKRYGDREADDATVVVAVIR